MSGNLKRARTELALLARQEGLRMVPESPDFPTKWWFGGVVDPSSTDYFTYPGAWEFVAEMLEDKRVVVNEVCLDKPKGATGYWFNVPTSNGEIYIKVHFGRGRKTILGRSFHYSGEEIEI